MPPEAIAIEASLYVSEVLDADIQLAYNISLTGAETPPGQELPAYSASIVSTISNTTADTLSASICVHLDTLVNGINGYCATGGAIVVATDIPTQFFFNAYDDNYNIHGRHHV